MPDTAMLPPAHNRSILGMVRALIFIVAMYGLLAVMGLACAIPSWLSRTWALVPIKGYCRAVLWLLRVIVGTKVEYRGDIPQQGCIVASKHQAFLDIIMLTAILPRPSFVMKESIKYIPVLNIYAERLGCIPINRNTGSTALKSILVEAERTKNLGRQVIIFPQGTRTAPGDDRPYKFGVIRLYQQLGQPIAMVALNSGWFWPRTGTRRSPGTTVVEFLGQIEPNRQTDGLLDEVSATIETGSNALAVEAAEQVSR